MHLIKHECRFDKKFDKQLLHTFYVTKISYLFTTKLVKQIINKFTFKIDSFKKTAKLKVNFYLLLFIVP
jgi:hypothetical protein